MTRPLPFKKKFYNRFIKIISESEKLIRERNLIERTLIRYKNLLYSYISKFSAELQWLNLYGYDFSENNKQKITEIYIRARKYAYGDNLFLQIKIMEDDLNELTAIFISRTLQIESENGEIFSNTEEWKNILKMAKIYEREKSGENTTN
jgi:hypothetical protein